MKTFEERDLLPEFPRTPHLPLNPNMGEDDIVADETAVQGMLKRDDTSVEEKVDGASVGICYYKGQFHVRNRRHILKKGHLHKNPSGQQFRPIWNWCYQHQGNFQLLNRMEPFSEEDPATVYGDWMWMAHGIQYTKLPSFLIAYDIYDARAGKMLTSRGTVRKMLAGAGFDVPTLLASMYLPTEHYLSHLTKSASLYYDGPVEGIYLRRPDWDTGGEKRYKMVREDFVGGKYFRENEIIRNLLRKS